MPVDVTLSASNPKKGGSVVLVLLNLSVGSGCERGGKTAGFPASVWFNADIMKLYETRYRALKEGRQKKK